MNGDRVKRIDVGASEYVSKSLTSVGLLSRLRLWLSRGANQV